MPFRRLSPSRYAEGLRKALRRDEPGRRIDLLLSGALIEARSHERFIGLIPLLPEPLGAFYDSLAAAEARHAGLYLRLAARGGAAIDARLRELAASRRSSRRRRIPSSGFTPARRPECRTCRNAQRGSERSSTPARATRARCPACTSRRARCAAPARRRRRVRAPPADACGRGPACARRWSRNARATAARVHVHDLRRRRADVHPAAGAQPAAPSAAALLEGQVAEDPAARAGCARCAAGAGSSYRRCRARRRASAARARRTGRRSCRPSSSVAPVSRQKRSPIRKSRLPCMTKQGTPAVRQRAQAPRPWRGRPGPGRRRRARPRTGRRGCRARRRLARLAVEEREELPRDRRDRARRGAGRR